MLRICVILCILCILFVVSDTAYGKKPKCESELETSVLECLPRIKPLAGIEDDTVVMNCMHTKIYMKRKDVKASSQTYCFCSRHSNKRKAECIGL